MVFYSTLVIGCFDCQILVPKMRHQDWKEFTSGFIAANINIIITYPFNKTMFRQMVHYISLKEALKQLKSEGALFLYRGVLPPLIHRGTTTSLMFGTNAKYSRLIQETTPIQNKSVISVASAVMAGCTEAALSPVERIQVLLQDSKNHSRFKNTIDAFSQIRRLHGFTEFYRGVTAVLVRNCPANVVYFSAIEYFSKPNPSFLLQFFTGACIGALISTANFPTNVCRTHMMVQLGGPFVSILHVFKTLLHERGIRGMFRGVHLNYTRSFLSWGIITVVHQRLRALLDKHY